MGVPELPTGTPDDGAIKRNNGKHIRGGIDLQTKCSHDPMPTTSLSEFNKDYRGNLTRLATTPNQDF